MLLFAKHQPLALLRAEEGEGVGVTYGIAKIVGHTYLRPDSPRNPPRPCPPWSRVLAGVPTTQVATQ